MSGDCPNFCGWSDVPLIIDVAAAKMGLSPFVKSRKTFTGDCPNFCGWSDVPLIIDVAAAKMGLSPFVKSRKTFTGDCPDFRGGKDVTRELTFSPRKWDCPPCAAKGDRSLFSAYVFCAKHDFLPKNGPVRIPAVNAYEVEENAMNQDPQTHGRAAGIDYGDVRIGIAISDSDRTIASPLENYTRRGLEQDATRFRRLVAEEGVTLFVVGLPIHLDGGESPKSREARQFGKWLGEVTGVPVEFYDERFTTVEAEEALLAADLTRKRRKKRRDMLAAQIMLSAYLESHERG